MGQLTMEELRLLSHATETKLDMKLPQSSVQMMKMMKAEMTFIAQVLQQPIPSTSSASSASASPETQQSSSSLNRMSAFEPSRDISSLDLSDAVRSAVEVINKGMFSIMKKALETNEAKSTTREWAEGLVPNWLYYPVKVSGHH